MGIVFQDFRLFPDKTVYENVAFAMRVVGAGTAEIRSRVPYVLNLVGLETKSRRHPKELSGGMKQRLLIAQSLLHDPDILILDEPTAGLDPRQRVAVRNLIGKIALHKIVLISTHVVQDVEYIAGELILLNEGNILCRGTPQQLLAALDGQMWELTVQESELEQVRQYGTVCGLAKTEDGICVRLLSSTKPVGSCAAKPDLEDVYLYHFGATEGL